MDLFARSIAPTHVFGPFWFLFACVTFFSRDSSSCRTITDGRGSCRATRSRGASSGRASSCTRSSSRTCCASAPRRRLRRPSADELSSHHRIFFLFLLSCGAPATTPLRAKFQRESSFLRALLKMERERGRRVYEYICCIIYFGLYGHDRICRLHLTRFALVGQFFLYPSSCSQLTNLD